MEMIKYETAIVDETGWVMFWCKDLQGWEQVETILCSHPEWSIRTIDVGLQEVRDMISSDIVTIISFDKEDEARLKDTTEVLEEILQAFRKAGTGNEMNCNYLAAVLHIINEIERGETF